MQFYRLDHRSRGDPELRGHRCFLLRGLFPNARAIKLTVADQETICPAPRYKKTKFAAELLDCGLHLADNRFFAGKQMDREFDLIIGSEHYWDLVQNYNRRSPDGLTAIPSKLGWMLHGPSKEATIKKSSSTNAAFIASASLPNLDEEEWRGEDDDVWDRVDKEPPPHEVFITTSAVSSTKKKEGKVAILPPSGSVPQQQKKEFNSCPDCRQIFWNLDSMEAVGPSEDMDDTDPLFNYKSKISRNKDGRLVAPFPWNDKKEQLRPQLELAKGRLESQLKKLRSNPTLLADYHQQIKHAIDNGFVAEADMAYKGVHTYLPHHAVVKPDRLTTKVRPVFDGSARSRFSPSINDCLHTGPNNNPELLAVLLRFRVPNIVWTSDIEKAFHQVELSPEDSEVVRFLWVENPQDPNSPIKHYVWKRLPFGLVCSPFMLRAVIDFLLDDFITIYPDTVKLIKNQLYVDDALGGASTVDVALKTIEEIKDIFSTAHMSMRKWITNSEVLQQDLGEDPSPSGG